MCNNKTIIMLAIIIHTYVRRSHTNSTLSGSKIHRNGLSKNNTSTTPSNRHSIRVECRTGNGIPSSRGLNTHALASTWQKLNS